MRIIGLCGKKRVGKDTAARFLCEKYELKQMSFAGGIYKMLEALPIDPMYREDRQLVIPWLGKTYTELLQTLGTEWGQRLIKKTLWVDIVDQQIRNLKEWYSGVVISDVREIHEAEYIHRLGGRIYRVVGTRGIVVNNHTSEQPLPDIYVAGTIPNYGSEDALRDWIQNEFL